MERRNAEPMLIDGMTADLGWPRTSALLDDLSRSIPREKLARPVRTLYKSDEKGGAPAWPAVTMLRCVMLAKWFNLSDPQLEENLKDRLWFRRFAGLSLMDKTPDQTTFVVFRRRLREAKMDRTLFDAVAKHLDGLGLLVKEGTLVDATIVEQAKGKKREDQTSTRDEDASFTKKHGRTYHGYKGHIATDRSEIVIDYRFSTASHHDSRYIDEMTTKEKQVVYGDSAYSSKERRERLGQRGVVDGICYKKNRGQAELYPYLERWNKMVSKVRALVEHPFARLKQSMGLRRVRYRGLRRNELDFAFNLIAHNLRRALSLSKMA